MEMLLACRIRKKGLDSRLAFLWSFVRDKQHFLNPDDL
jgi:hypothetical protein